MPQSSRPNVAFQVAPQAPSIANNKFSTSTDVLDFRATRHLPRSQGSGATSNDPANSADYQSLKRKADAATKLHQNVKESKPSKDISVNTSKTRASISTKKTAIPKTRPYAGGPTKLRAGRPVKAALCADLWPIIFQYSESSVLLYMKDVAPLFREILERNQCGKKAEYIIMAMRSRRLSLD
jgi:hypothetical protein